MDYKGLLRRPGKIPQPAENLLLIGMGRKAVDRFDFRANGDHLPEHLDLLFPVLKRSAACPFSLKSNELPSSNLTGYQTNRESLTQLSPPPVSSGGLVLTSPGFPLKACGNDGLR